MFRGAMRRKAAYMHASLHSAAASAATRPASAASRHSAAAADIFAMKVMQIVVATATVIVVHLV
uniref:Uncharacterized protein n=1 Tax=Oryza brachyantha TaxID=4533 RepID=J3M4G2_ORYBR